MSCFDEAMRHQKNVYVFQAGIQEGSLELWLTPADFDGSPTWNSSIDEPPLSLRRAIDISRDYCTEKHPTLIKFSVQSISLSKCQFFQKDNEDGIWTYSLHCGFIDSDKPVFITTIVLMNGKIFEPELRPWNETKST